jgi:hypothetical protein
MLWIDFAFWNRIRIQEHGNRSKLTHKHGFQPFKKLLYRRRYVFLTYYNYLL